MKKQMIMTSSHDVPVILLTQMKGVYKEMHTSPGGSSFGSSSLVRSLVDSSGKPQTFCLGYLSAS